MNFHGFQNVEGFITASRQQKFSVTTEKWTKTSDCRPVPSKLNYALAQREGYDPNVTEVVILLNAPPMRTATAITSWHIFDSKYEHYYADGWKDEYKELLSCWGFAPEAEAATEVKPIEYNGQYALF